MNPTTLFFTVIFVALVAAVSLWQKLGLERDLLVGAVRAAVQLVAVGYVLVWVFGARSWVPLFLMLGLMMGVAAYHAAKRAEGIRGVHLRVLAAIGLAELVTVGLMLALGIIPATAQYIIPISGMVIGNAMINAGLLLNRLQGEVAARSGEIEVMLALGATSRQASAQVLKAAVRAAMIPSVDALKTVGLVQLPGMMTGQILAGASPLEAVKYQILVMYSLAAAAAICSMVLGLLSISLFFNKQAQLVR